MDFLPYLLIPFYLLLAFMITWVIGEVYYRTNKIKNYLLPALGIKFLGCIVFVIIYQFYYGGGDTFVYFKSGVLISEQLSYDPLVAWEILKSSNNNYNIYLSELIDDYNYFKADSTMLIVKVISIISLFSFKNYFLTSLVYAFICFWGQWLLFRTFTKILPCKETMFFLICFCIPSVVFWCGGILKDTLMLGCVGTSFYALHEMFFLKKKFLFGFLLLFFSMYAMWAVKFYIPMALIPAFSLWIIFTFFTSVENAYLRSSLLLVFVAGTLFCLYIIQTYLGGYITSIVDALFQKVIGFHVWHGYLDQKSGGSGYSLGDIEFTILGVLKKFPASINVTFFRPYLWEAKSLVVFVAAIESLGLTFLFFYSVLKTGIFNFIKTCLSHPFIVFCVSFSLIFGFFVGFTSYNFGALVRYKTPCLPFFVAILMILPYLKSSGYFKKSKSTGSIIKTINKTSNSSLEFD